MANLPYQASICSREVHHQLSAYMKANGRRPTESSAGIKRRLSLPAQRLNRHKLNQLHQRPDAQEQPVRAANATATKRRHPHQCAPGCFNILPKATPAACSLECRRRIRQETMRAVSKAHPGRHRAVRARTKRVQELNRMELRSHQ